MKDVNQSPDRLPLLILFATMTGNTGDAVEQLSVSLAHSGIGARIVEMRVYDPRRLAGERTVLFLTSTFGNGDPPDPAFAFWDVLRKADDLNLSGMHYSVLALGDSAYPRFCQFGTDLDARLAELKARRLADLQTCDVDWEEPFEQWRASVLAALEAESGPGIPT